MSNYKPVPPQFEIGQVIMYRSYSQKFPLPQPQLAIIIDRQDYSSSHLAPGRQHNYRIRTYGHPSRETWIVDESLLAQFI
jgi:hypothetical protein